MSLLSQDLRLALRGLIRSPLFSIVAILSLALGIGANTAIFTLIDQLLLRKLPVKNPDELVMLYQQGPHAGSNMGSADALVPDLPGVPEARRAAGRGRSRAGLVATSISVDNQTERVDAEMVSGNFFSMLGVPAAVGPRVQLAGGRPGLPGPPRRGPGIRLLGHAASTATPEWWAADPRQQLPDDHRRRLGGGIRRYRPGARARDARARFR